MSCPSHIPEGQVVESLHSHYDLMPTLLDYLNVENPEADALPGQSFAPLLQGEMLAGHEQVVVFD